MYRSVMCMRFSEIPNLRKLLRMHSRSFPQKREVDYIKEAQGVLSLIQGSNCDSDTDVEFVSIMLQ